MCIFSQKSSFLQFKSSLSTSWCERGVMPTSARLKGFPQSGAQRAAAVQQSVGGQDGQVSRSVHGLWGGAVS